MNITEQLSERFLLEHYDFQPLVMVYGLCYRLPTKLREGNVFLCCLSVSPWGSHATINHDSLDVTIQRPSPDPDPYPFISDTWWPTLETCSKLLT